MNRPSAWLALTATLLATPGALAYEFEVRARTVGQGLDLRVRRPISGNLSVTRRRFTQTLNLNIWDLGDSRRRTWSSYTRRRSGARFSLISSLRIDHDYGDWSSGTVNTGNRIFDAIDLVPELEESSAALDVLTLYLAAEEMLGGRVDVYVGRQLTVGALEWWSFDGVTTRVRTPAKLAVEAFGGLRVRDSSFAASSVTELDGTGSGQCLEYVEGTVVGSGAWRPIDIGVPSERRFRNDLDVCPQRDALMPTFGGSIATAGLSSVFARVSYRRSVSASPGLIGDVDRFDQPDTGFYPNEVGQAPGWGVNEEKLTATIRGKLAVARERVELVPFAAGRYSLLHGLLDEFHAGSQIRLGAHRVTPEVFYSFPTFDGDSIFNVFSIQPYWDLRATYSYWSSSKRASLFARPWARRFSLEDGESGAGASIQGSDWAGGLQAGGRLRLGLRHHLRTDAFWEDGYGGRRRGGSLGGRWQTTRQLGLAARLSLIDLQSDGSSNYDGLNTGLQLLTAYQVFRGIGLRLWTEYNHSEWRSHHFRVIAILDFAFRPEL